MTTTMSIKLTYFDIEGVAEPIRLAFALSGTDYDDERIHFEDWKDLKPKTPYGKLPLLTINNKSPPHTQSMAMLRWAGLEFSETLYPRDKLLAIEEVLGLLEEAKQTWGPSLLMGRMPEAFGHPADLGSTDEGKALLASLRSTWIETVLPVFLGFWSDMIDKNDGQWLASTGAPTIADCAVVPFLRNFTRGHVDHVPTNCLESHPKIVDYIKRFCALEPIQGRYTNGVH